MEERLNRIGYKKREDLPKEREWCSGCAYGFTKIGDIDNRLCKKHNMIVGANDGCDYFEDWGEVTEEGRKFRACVQNLAEIHLKNEKAENNKTSQNSEGCYIATAVYGGYDTTEVLILRKFRDEILNNSFLGRAFIKLYYTISPSMAVKLKQHDRLNAKVKYLLDKFVEYLTNKK